MSSVGMGSTSEGDGGIDEIQSMLASEDDDAIMTDSHNVDLHSAVAAVAAAQRARDTGGGGDGGGEGGGPSGSGAGAGSAQGSRQEGQSEAGGRRTMSPPLTGRMGMMSGAGEGMQSLAGTAAATSGTAQGAEGMMQTGEMGMLPVNPPSICLCQQPQRIPRPRNAFILFRQHHHASVVQQNPGKANPEISKIIGELWRESTPETKAIWQKHADNEKRQHLARFPEYRYQPRRNQGKKGAAGSTIGASTITLENAICPNCGGRTGLMSSPATPATPATPMSAVPRNLRNPLIPQTPTTARLPPHMTLPPAPSPRTPRKKQTGESENTSKGVEALLQLGLRPETESEDPSSSSTLLQPPATPGPGDSPLATQTKKRKLNQIFSQHAMMRDVLATPGLPTGGLEGMENFLHTADMLKTAGFPDIETSSELEQHFAAIQAQVQAQAQHAAQLQGLDIEGVSTLSVIDKLQAIRRICKPLPALPTPGAQTRGAVIAIEGEDPDSVTQLAEGLAENLKRESVTVQIISQTDDLDVSASSSSSQTPDRFMQTAKLLENMAKWHRMSSSVRSIVLKSPSDPTSSTGPTSAPSEQPSSSADPSSTSAPSASTSTEPGKVPIVLFNRYTLSRTDSLCNSSSLTPLNEVDNLTLSQHWQWLASLWRGCVGADMTIVVRSISAPPIGGSGGGGGEEIETRDDARILLVRKVQGRPWSEKTIRRLGFEVSEWVRTLQGFME